MMGFASLKVIAALGGVAVLGFQPLAARADTGEQILQQRCASCHDLTGPAPQTLAALWARKGPDLFYAGNKFQASWLVTWLQNPQRIRPAGEFYEDHIKPGSDGDQVDEATLQPHLALPANEAQSVADALMQRKPHDDLMAQEKMEPVKVSKSMGEMIFNKFTGCMACHRIEADYGGLSGPELYTAGNRLQPQFMASYIRSPRSWDPKIWMPNKQVSDQNIQKIVHYLVELSSGVKNGK